MTEEEHHERLEHLDDEAGYGPVAVEAAAGAADVLAKFVAIEMNGRLVSHAFFHLLLVRRELGRHEFRAVVRLLAFRKYRYEVYSRA